MKKNKRQQKDAREKGRIILAHGETTGHRHEILTAEAGMVPGESQVMWFAHDDGSRELVVIEPCRLQHGAEGQPQTADHDPIYLWPDGSAEKRHRVTGEVLQARVPGVMAPVRQGDVFLAPTSPGSWTCIGQREGYSPESWRQVSD